MPETDISAIISESGPSSQPDRPSVSQHTGGRFFNLEDSVQKQINIDQVAEEKTNNADLTLLEDLRNIGMLESAFDGIPAPQMQAIIRRLLEYLQQRSGDEQQNLGYVTGFADAFRLAHDYVARHGPLWITRAVDAETVPHGTADREETNG
ncbi:MAG: hypothetical protein QF368_05865 [SAR202 cluster bacterium]|nr:hypothetical protein [SAR202 cluster bacterium]